MTTTATSRSPSGGVRALELEEDSRPHRVRDLGVRDVVVRAGAEALHLRDVPAAVEVVDLPALELVRPVGGSIARATASTPSPCAPNAPSAPYFGSSPGANTTSRPANDAAGYILQTAVSCSDCVVTSAPDTRLPSMTERK